MSHRLEGILRGLLVSALPAVALLSGRGARAEGEPARVSAADILRAAVEHSPRLRAADQDLEAAAARRDEAAALGWPSLHASASLVRYEGLVDTVLGPALTVPGVEERYSAAVRLTQPLYTGGLISSRRRSAAFGRRGAEACRQSVEADVILHALTAYWDWSKAFHARESLRAAVERMEAHATDTRNLHEAGLATDNDTLATDVLLDQTRLRLGEARRREGVARARVAFLSGRDIPAGTVPEVAPLARAPALPAEPASLDAAMANRWERTARRMEASAAESQVRAARAEAFPQVSLVAGYELANPNHLFFPPDREWNDDAFAGLVVSWKLFDGGLTRARTREAAARAAQARLRQGHEDEQIALQVRRARAEVEDARERVTVTARAEQSAARNLETATALWHSGLARHSDVLDAHARLTTSQDEAVGARADALLADAALEHATGTLPARWREPSPGQAPDSAAGEAR